jgi:hypothetical protein
MKPKIFVLFLITLLSFSSKGQNPQPKEFYSKEFGWRIKIPKGFKVLSEDEQKEIYKKSSEVLEDNYGIDTEGGKSLFIMRSGNFNQFESNWDKFNPEEGSFEEQFSSLTETLLDIVESQMPTANIDSSSFRETIGGLDFYGFKITIKDDFNFKMEYLIYSRRFADKYFVLSIVTMDKEKQRQLLEVWRKSTFER